MLASFMSAALLSIFLQNSIFERALGINILIYAARKRSSVIGFTLGLCYITTLSSIAAWGLDRAYGGHEYYAALAPALYILIIGVLYLSSLIAVWRFFHNLFKKIKKFVHLTVFNCAVLGALFISSQSGSGLPGYLGYGLGTGLGFLVAGFLLYVAHPRLNSELVPLAFRGMPIMVIYIGILSLALHAFVGYSASI
ncbi:MAG: hypothetical protein LBI36_04075 [Oscillospiraceae bacterium]|jgi:electron transport complex protein RnfA|nr:hypothetical protein [Oscillospiraceae bacterium]